MPVPTLLAYPHTPSSGRGYRCLYLNTDKIILSRHVTFDETVFPAYADGRLIATKKARLVGMASPNCSSSARCQECPYLHGSLISETVNNINLLVFSRSPRQSYHDLPFTTITLWSINKAASGLLSSAICSLLLLRVGFLHSQCDSSLFIYRQGSDTAYLLLYVDDIVLTASSTALLQRIIASLHAEFSMTDLGPLNYFLGVSVTRNTF
ncbi:ribonuclease H-like domain-containing protein [Tanacetum coccineum]